MHPHSRVAVRLQLAAHSGTLRTRLTRVMGAENPLKILDVMTPLVGDDVLLREHRIGGAVLGDHVVEETEIQVDGGISGAIERANGARCATARR